MKKESTLASGNGTSKTFDDVIVALTYPDSQKNLKLKPTVLLTKLVPSLRVIDPWHFLVEN